MMAIIIYAYYICTAREGVEFETFVLDCPLFKERIVVERSRKIWDEGPQSGQFVIEKAKLVEKDSHRSWIS